jgi:hypothetical protein
MKRDSGSPSAYRKAVEGGQGRLLEVDSRLHLGGGSRHRGDDRVRHAELSGTREPGAQKHYVSLYVIPAVLAEHRDAFPGLSAGKSCLRFRKLEQLDPAPLRKLLADVLVARRRGASSS